MSNFTLQWRIEKQDSGKLVREFLSEREISKASLTDIKFSGGRISVNEEEVTVRRVLVTGDLLQVEFPREESTVQGEDLPLDILYEDPYFLVVNKPAGMNTIPSREHPSGSLANGLIGYYLRSGVAGTPHIVTRLDRDTSGLVLVAKHRHIHHLFSKQQRKGLVERTYEAIAEGVFTNGQGKIEYPIGRKKDSIIEREVQEEGQYACTHFHVIKQYEAYAHVRLKLETGRTHQIRVHLSHIGHPLCGDDLYGGTKREIMRQALHCCQLSFHHPFTKEILKYEQPLPLDMKRLLEDLP